MEKKVKIYLLLVIAERGKGDSINKRLAGDVFGFTTFLGRGTAKKHWMNLLGIGNIEKDLVALMLDETQLANARGVLEEEYKIGRGGGVAFALRVESIADKRVLEYFTAKTEVE